MTHTTGKKLPRGALRHVGATLLVMDELSVWSLGKFGLGSGSSDGDVSTHDAASRRLWVRTTL